MKKKATKKKAIEPVADRREYIRVPVASDWGELQPLLGAILHWPNHETSPVFDLSYFGVAASRPALFAPLKGDRLELRIELGKEASIPLKGKMAWGNDKVIGIQLDPLKVEARQAFDDFLEDRLIGLNLRRVDRRHYGPFDFSVWYHGPHDTNVYLWQDIKTDKILKAEIELDGRVLIFDGKQLLSGGARAASLTDQIGAGSRLAVDDDDLPVEVEDHNPLVKRALSILSQVDEPRGPMRDFLTLLAKAAK